MIMKLNLIPMQDDHENGMSGVGVLRPDANKHAERGRVNSRTDPGILEGQRSGQLRGPKQKGGVRVGSEHAGGSGVHATRQEAAGNHPGLGGKGDRARQRAAASPVPFASG